jgi:DUF4097 and DUF4098 domain-containing protein YvlB
VKTADGDIRISSINGGLDIFSTSGSIDIKGDPSELYAETMSGKITAFTNTSSARLKTAAGAIQVSGAIADLTAVTVSAPIDVVKTSFQRARLESVDGNISFRGGLPPKSQLDVTNHAGAIDFFVPANASASFVVSLYEGMLKNEFGLKPVREGTLALGKAPSAKVTIRSFKGRATLRKL